MTGVRPDPTKDIKSADDFLTFIGEPHVVTLNCQVSPGGRLLSSVIDLAANIVDDVVCCPPSQSPPSSVASPQT